MSELVSLIGQRQTSPHLITDPLKCPMIPRAASKMENEQINDPLINLKEALIALSSHIRSLHISSFNYNLDGLCSICIVGWNTWIQK